MNSERGLATVTNGLSVHFSHIVRLGRTCAAGDFRQPPREAEKVVRDDLSHVQATGLGLLVERGKDAA